MSGVRYTDQRITAEQLETVRDKLSYGQLPSLKVDQQVLYQSMAIARWDKSTYIY